MADEVTLEVFAKDVAAGSEEARLALAKQLKAAGLWSGKVSGKFNINYYTALGELEKKYKAQIALNNLIGSQTPITRYDILTELLVSESEGSGSTGRTTQTYVTSPSQTAAVLDKVAQDLIGRNLTKAEKAKYTSFVNAQQKKNPAIQTTTRSGRNVSTSTQGGVDEQQIITDKLSQTSEAKNYRVTDAYTIMMQELGGLQ